jgi:hypothetical protein
MKMEMYMNTNAVPEVREIDEALAADKAGQERQTEERLAAVSRERDKISRIGMALRYVGIAVLLAATGSFMFQRWGDMTHLTRYLSFLIFTVGVCGAGLLCGLKIGENKGARTLLGVVVTLLPVHAAQLGAIIFSQVGSATTTSGSYPSALYWSVSSLSDVLIAVGVGVATLVPMAFMAYSVLARSHALQLLTLGCGVSAALMIPSRDPVVVGAIMALASACTLIGEIRFASVLELRTREGAIARSVPFIAVGMLIGRQCFLYGATSLFTGLVCIVGGAIAFELVPRLRISSLVTTVSEHLSVYLVGLGGFFVGDAVIQGFDLSGSALAPLVIGLPMGAAFTVMAERARESTGVFRFASAATLFTTGVVELMNGSGMEAGVVSLLIGIVALTVACISERRGMLLAGVALITLSLGRVLLEAFGTVSVSPWVILGVIGVGTIVGASYIERNFIRIRETCSALRRRIAAWS